MRNRDDYYYDSEPCSSEFEETEDSVDRFNGVIFGTLTADAYAVGFEGKPNFTAYRLLANANVRKGRPTFGSALLGGGEFKLKPGQLHYHSEWALVNIHALLNRRAFREDEVAMEYALWARSNPPGLPAHLKRVLNVGHNCFDPMEFAKRVKHNAKTINNNRVDTEVLIRQIGLAAMYRLADEYTLMRISERDTRLTHTHPMMIAAAKVFVVTMQRLMLGHSCNSSLKSALELSKELNPLVYHFIELTAGGYGYSLWPIENLPASELPENYDQFGFDLHCAFISLQGCHRNPIDALERAIKRTPVKPCMRTSLTGALAGAYHGISQFSGKWYVKMTKAPIRHRRVKALKFLQGEYGARQAHRLRLSSVKFWTTRKFKRGELKSSIPDCFKVTYKFFKRSQQRYIRKLMPFPRCYYRVKRRPRYIRDNDDYAERPPKPLVIPDYKDERDRAFVIGEDGKIYS